MRAKVATVLTRARATCSWCGIRSSVDPRLSSGLALLMIFLFFLSNIEYAISGSHWVLAFFFVFTVASLYSMIRFAPLRRSG